MVPHPDRHSEMSFLGFMILLFRVSPKTNSKKHQEVFSDSGYGVLERLVMIRERAEDPDIESRP